MPRAEQGTPRSSIATPRNAAEALYFEKLEKEHREKEATEKRRRDKIVLIKKRQSRNVWLQDELSLNTTTLSTASSPINSSQSERKSPILNDAIFSTSPSSGVTTNSSFALNSSFRRHSAVAKALQPGGGTPSEKAATLGSPNNTPFRKAVNPEMSDTLEVEEIDDESDENDDIFKEVLALIFMADYQKCCKIVKSQRSALLPKMNGVYSCGNTLLHACALSIDENDNLNCAKIEGGVMDPSLALLVK